MCILSRYKPLCGVSGPYSIYLSIYITAVYNDDGTGGYLKCSSTCISAAFVLGLCFFTLTIHYCSIYLLSICFLVMMIVPQERKISHYISVSIRTYGRLFLEEVAHSYRVNNKKDFLSLCQAFVFATYKYRPGPKTVTRLAPPKSRNCFVL